MKKHLQSFYPLTIIVLILYLSMSCSQDKKGDLGFPRVRTLIVEMISDTGAVFKGEIVDIPSDCEILDYGFMWSESISSTIQTEKISLGRSNKTGIFQASVNRAMVAGRKYYFKSYIKTATTTIYGNELNFVSLGSLAPVITSITPSSGSWKDTLTIRGKNFSNNTYQMLVYFNNYMGNNISTTDSTIRVVVPLEVDTAYSKVYLQYANVKYPAKQEFHLVPDVEVTGIEPTSGWWNTTLQIKGNHLSKVQKVIMDKLSCQIISQTDTAIFFKIPAEIKVAESTVSVKVRSFQIDASQKFKILPGEIKSISRSEGTAGDQITISGKNFRLNKLKLTIGGVKMSILQTTDSILKTEIPNLKTAGAYTITIFDSIHTYSSAQEYKYFIPEVSDIQPKIGNLNDTLTIIGKHLLGLKMVKIYFGDAIGKKENVQIVDLKDESIKIKIPSNHNQAYKWLYLESDYINLKCYEEFNIAKPLINSVNSQLCWGDTLIISGENMKLYPNIELHLGYDDYLIEPISILEHSNDKIKAIIPLSHDYSNNTIFLKSGSTLIYSGKLTMEEPKIENVSYVNSGQTRYISIKGNNLNSTNKTVSIENLQNLTILSSSPTEIQCKNIELLRNTYIIKVALPGINLQSYLKSESPFSEYATIRNIRMNTGSLLLLNGNLYFGDIINKKLYEFDFEIKTVSDLNISYPYNFTKTFSINGEGYFIQQHKNEIDRNDSLEIFKFIPENNSLKKCSNFPEIVFSVNFSGIKDNIAYAGFGLSNEIYQYSSIENTWDIFGVLPVEPFIQTYVFFYNNKMYLLNKKSLYAFDLQSSNWINKKDFPGNGRTYAMAFKIFNKAFFGAGYTNTRDLWEYDFVADTWTQIKDFPQNTNWTIYYSFERNGKGYFICYKSGEIGYQVVEFDPAFIYK